MKPVTIALLGNPNCGKSTLFNALTGGRAHVGNWPGVTVERKSGTFCESGSTIEVIDLPGTYSLTAVSEQQAIDEQIACEAIARGGVGLVVNVVDVNNLQRHLYLTAQLLAMEVPVILAVNRVDVLKKQGGQCDFRQLANLTGCVVVPLCASKKQGITELRQAIMQVLALNEKTQFPLIFPDAIEEGISSLQSLSGIEQRWQALQVLSGDNQALLRAGNHREVIAATNAKIEQDCGEEVDILIAGTRYSWAADVEKQTMHLDSEKSNTPQSRLDRWVLHRFLGIPIFLAAMYFMFLFAINFGGAFQDFFDKASEALFVTGTAQVLHAMNSPEWLVAIIANGAGRGINTTLTFIPVIGAMFFFLALLEGSGYMTRSAFVVDRLMRVMGLPGKSFVPMIVGFGCNVPAIMAARTIENHRDRVLTIMMSPFMSCGARLAIFALFTAAFFPVGGQNIVFALYLIGILMAVLTGLALRKTLLRGKPEPLVMEMPAYHRPSFKSLLRPTVYHLKNFLIRAGMVIIPVCMILGALNSIHVGAEKTASPQKTALASMGQAITPVFGPMGITNENWPATVGLLTGILSKEVVVGTLNTLYSQDASIIAEDKSVGAGLKAAVLSVPANVLALTESLRNPILASAPIEETHASVFGVMYERFGGQVAAFSYLLFVLLYVPCISATAAMVRELNRRWALFSALWTTGVAYGVAVIFYQSATITQHVFSSLAWITSITVLFVLVLFIMRRYALDRSSENTLGALT
jgi:ferrous iron transport protein B